MNVGSIDNIDSIAFSITNDLVFIFILSILNTNNIALSWYLPDWSGEEMASIELMEQ